MDVTEQLPNILVSAFKTKERIVTEVYSLLAYLNVHLHGYMLKALNEALADVLQVMIAHDKIYLAMKPIKNLRPLCCSTQTEITQMKHCVINSYYTIPICYHYLVHLHYILERTIAEAYDIRMVEVRI